MSNTKSNTIVKKRYWGAVVYPDSLPDNWLELLQLTGLPIAISPLHDLDVNSDGEIKKPHHHIILCFNGPTAIGPVKRITDSLNAPIPIPLESVKGAYRYFTHMDNPEKFQYQLKDIVHLNGFDPLDFIGFTSSEVESLKKDLFCIIRDYHIYEYCELIDLLAFQKVDIDEKKLADLFYCATSNTILFNNYLKSKRYSKLD